MASFSSTQSTQPFSDVSQPGANLEQLIASFPQTSAAVSSQPDLGLVRIFARCHMYKTYISVDTFPDRTPATILDHDVLAISQSTVSTGCDVRIPAFDNSMMAIHLRLHFDPSQDAITAQNASYESNVTLQPTSSTASSQRLLTPGQYLTLQPGAWTIVSTPSAGSSHLSIEVLDLHIQPRNFWVSTSGVAPAVHTGSKRRHDKASSSSKKQKVATGSRLVQTSAVSVHPLLELQDGEIIRMEGQHRNDNYQLTRHKHLISTSSASLYTASYSLRPGQVVVTKALKLGNSAHSTAQAWQREVATHQGIGQHPSIVRLYGSDARSFTLYMEFIDSPSLDKYRDSSNMCTCPAAAFTILSDLANALQHIHTAGLVHNDIKPANIIYHKNRGAILIDFGLGGRTAETSNSGSPWYLPPEYLTRNTRGPPSDIFALGVTMLWVLQKCSLPNAMDEWKIRDVHDYEGLSESRRRAQKAMSTWLEQVETMRTELSRSRRNLESVVRRILVPERRDTAAKVVEHLESVIP